MWLGLFLVICFAGCVRIRLLDLPLERDEGEYAYMGRLMLEGTAPFKLAYSMKLPGTSAMYALIMAVFGQTTVGIHLGLLVLNAATIGLVFLLGRKLIDDKAGFIAAASYAILSLHPSVMGIVAHATNFVIFFALAGMLMLLRAMETRRISVYFLSGVLLGLGFVMKQPGLFFVLFGLLFLIRMEWKQGAVNRTGFAARIASFSIGAALPFALICIWLWRAGVFRRFWFWTFTYTNYGSRQTPGQGWQNLEFHVESEMGWDILFWLVAAVGMFFLWRDKAARFNAIFLTTLLLISIVAVGQGLYFRPHYFILALPAVCLLIGGGYESARCWLAKTKALAVWQFAPAAIFAAVGALVVLGEAPLFFEYPATRASEYLYATYGPNPFPTSGMIAGFVRDHTQAGDTMAVLGSEPQIYFQSQRKSATGYLYTYSLMEPGPLARPMQSEMMVEIEAAKPEIIVLAKLTFSWGITPQSDGTILAWAQKYCADNYEVVGVLSYPVKSAADIHWEADAARHMADSKESIYVFKRKPASPAAPNP